MDLNRLYLAAGLVALLSSQAKAQVVLRDSLSNSALWNGNQFAHANAYEIGNPSFFSIVRPAMHFRGSGRPLTHVVVAYVTQRSGADDGPNSFGDCGPRAPECGWEVIVWPSTESFLSDPNGVSTISGSVRAWPCVTNADWANPAGAATNGWRVWIAELDLVPYEIPTTSNAQQWVSVVQRHCDSWGDGSTTQILYADGPGPLAGGADRYWGWSAQGGLFLDGRLLSQYAAPPGPNFAVRVEAMAPACPGDYDGNGAVEPSDIAGFITTWIGSLSDGGLAGDFDANGVVEPRDIAAFVNAWLSALTNGC